jgi:DNA-binding MarR family transcriptional regulator
VGYLSDPVFLVLHTLRLKGFAQPDAVTRATGIDEGDVRRILDTAVADGLATRRDGRISGYALTVAGRNRHQTMLNEEHAASGADRREIDAAYRGFLAVNGDLLRVCTDWQMRDGDGGVPVLNDHGDAAYDVAVIERLGRVDEAVQPLCASLAATLARFDGYGPRLRQARTRVEAGERDWLTKPLVDSYHTIWFELHEDLLCTLGLERSKEGP